MLRKAAYQSRCIYAQMTAKCRALLMSRNFAISAKLDKSYAIKASGARKKKTYTKPHRGARTSISGLAINH